MELNEAAIDVLAAVDALFRPYRTPGVRSDENAVRFEGRRDYAVGGLPWIAGGADEAKRKQCQRSLEAATVAGMVEAVKHKGRTTAVRLTELGDQHARALAGLADLEIAADHLRKLIKATAAGKCAERYCRKWVPETLLAGCKWGDPKGDNRGECLFGHVQLELAPALCRGWVVSNADIQGRVWYSVTPDGLQAKPAMLDNLPERNDVLAARFDAEFQAQLARLASIAPQSSTEIGECPMPVSFLTPEQCKKFKTWGLY